MTALSFALVAALPPSAAAVTPLEREFVSSDITLVLGGVTVEPRDVAAEESSVTLLDLGPLAPGARIAGFEGGASGQRYLSFDQAISLPGVAAEARDVIGYDGVSYTLALDGAARGVPAGARIDAVARAGNDLLVSFDVTVALGGITAEDEDLVRVGPSSVSLFFDGSAAGVPAGLDLDAAQLLSNGHLLLSFDGSGRLGSVDFGDEDVLEYDPGDGSWEMAYDGSARASGWVGADLDAFAADEVPTPTPTDTATETPTDTPTATETVVATSTSTAVPTATAPPITTSTPTEAVTATPVDTASPTRVPTDTPTGTVPTATATTTESAIDTPTPTPEVTSTPTPTAEESATPSPTVSTPTPTPSPTSTETAAPTATLPVGTFFAGDANCDGFVTSPDLTAIANLIGLDMQACGSDADCDGDTDAADVDAVIAIVYSGAPLAPCN